MEAGAGNASIAMNARDHAEVRLQATYKSAIDD
jgi:hypothetical protein